MSEIKWIDKRSDKRKLVRLDVLDPEGVAVGEVQTLFDPNDQSTLAGAVMEISENLKEGYKLKRVDTTFRQVRKEYAEKVVYLNVRSAC